ncbi:MAG: hypothetical protein EXQ47_04745 [Bryobacterales bacterium]|nr:hypothetical protein [Bryobacterales bacterium]
MKALLFLAASLFACGQIDQPRIGVMLDQRGNARAVIGVAGSATTSEPIWQGVSSLACSAQVCVAKVQNALLLSSGETVEAPPGQAVVAIEGGTVYAYFAAVGQLMQWRDGQLEPVHDAPDGELLDLRVARDGLQYAVRRAGGVWAGGEYLGDATAVLLLDGGALLATGEQVRLLRPDGTEMAFPVPGVASFVRMSDGYVQMIAPHGMWALRIEPGHEQVFLLPGVSQE